jgi:hypothetical protein
MENPKIKVIEVEVTKELADSYNYCSSIDCPLFHAIKEKIPEINCVGVSIGYLKGNKCFQVYPPFRAEDYTKVRETGESFKTLIVFE